MPACLLEDAIASYALYAEAEGRSRRTINEKIRVVREFCRFLNRDDLATIIAEDLRRYLVYLRYKRVWSGTKYAKERLLSQNSINSYYRSICGFWNYLEKDKKIMVNPFSTVNAPELSNPLKKILTEEELLKVWQTVLDNPLEKALFALLIDSGIRLAELTGLTLEDIDYSLYRCRVLGKGNKERFAHFSEETVTILKEYLLWRDWTGYKGQAFWVSVKGTALTAKRVQKIFEAIGKKAGLEFRLSPHKLRHTYATEALKHGLNLEYLRLTMGHEDIETTSNSYLHPLDDDVARACREASPLSRLLGKKPGNLASKNDSFPVKQVVSQVPYPETEHHRRMREMAGELAKRICIPSLSDKELWRDLPMEFNPGKYYLPIGMVDIDKGEQIAVTYLDLAEGLAEPYLVKALLSHFKTSGIEALSKCIGDNGKLREHKKAVERYVWFLITYLKAVVNEVTKYHTKFIFNDEMMPGITRWFIITIWKDAVDRAGGSHWIDNSWYKPPEDIPGTNLKRLRCGGDFIGIARTGKTLKTYERWHKTLRKTYAQDVMARDISDMQRDFGNLVQDIRQELRRFCDFEYLPGHCELCRGDSQ